MNWTYRFGQVLNALWAKPKPQDRELVEEFLSPALAQWFSKLMPSEQTHAVRVCQQLIKEGETDRILLTAALLHDIGKTRYRLRLWERVWIVMFGWISRRLGTTVVLKEDELEQATWWKRCLIVGEFHPLWGAELLRQQGVEEEVVWLVEHHQESFEFDPSDPKHLRLMKLERADHSW